MRGLEIEKKNEDLLESPHIDHTTTKQVISCRGKNENGYEMHKNEKCTQRAKLLFFFVKHVKLARFCRLRHRGCLSSL